MKAGGSEPRKTTETNPLRWVKIGRRWWVNFQCRLTHLHRLKSIDVIVRYAGRDVRRAFRPSATVGRVKKWATRELSVEPSDAAELMLQISGTDNRPDADIHIGTLVKAPKHSLEFDLVPSPRVNG